jgi:DNA uptake protein ComE-like DNA-binding protein
LTDAEIDTLIDYLAKTWAKVNVNKANADDLVKALNFQAAAAHREYREKNGTEP